MTAELTITPEGNIDENDQKKPNMKTELIPEGCKLVAAHTGDGWILGVQNDKDETIAFLGWPESWPASVTTQQLESFGFEVV